MFCDLSSSQGYLHGKGGNSFTKATSSHMYVYLMCAIRLPHINSLSFHTILNIYYHVNKCIECFFTVITIHVNEQSCKLCNLVLTQGKMHG